MKQTLSLLILQRGARARFWFGLIGVCQTTTWTGREAIGARRRIGTMRADLDGTAYFDITGTGNLIVTLSSPVTVETSSSMVTTGRNGGNYIIGSTTGNVMTSPAG